VRSECDNIEDDIVNEYECDGPVPSRADVTSTVFINFADSKDHAENDDDYPQQESGCVEEINLIFIPRYGQVTDQAKALEKEKINESLLVKSDYVICTFVDP
jgi:hypothetical protein